MAETIVAYRIVIILILSSVLDFFFGDPRWLPHPIIYMGKLISFLEKVLKPDCSKKDIPKGTLLWFITVGLSFVIPLGILIIVYKINFYLGLALEVFWCFQIFAARTLAREANKVKKILDEGDIEEARKALSMIVGRDTASLSKEDITKAVVETVSENTTDGVISPLIAIAIGGAPLGFFYKAINTLDSMVGYKSKKYFFFGKVSAIMDDIANYIPARITGFLMVIAAYLMPGLSGGNSLKIMIRDHGKHASPNGGWTEGATAGALGVNLGGSAYYFGVLHEKASLGDDIRTIETGDIKTTTGLLWLSSFFLLIIVVSVRLILVLF